MKNGTNFIADQTVEDALHRLVQMAPKIGNAKAALIKAEGMTKVTLAIEMKRHNSLPVNAQEREARASEKYQEALTREAEAAGEFEKLKSQSKADEMWIEAWRTMKASDRAGRL